MARRQHGAAADRSAARPVRPGNGPTSAPSRASSACIGAAPQAFRVALDGNFGVRTMNGYALGSAGPATPDRCERHPGRDARPSGSPAGASARLASSPGRSPGLERSDTERRTIRMLKAAGRPWPRLRARRGQGSTPARQQPEATHAGGGAADLSVGARCGRSIKRVVRSLAGRLAAWSRNWTRQRGLHAVAISDPDMADEIAFPGCSTCASRSSARPGARTASTAP